MLLVYVDGAADDMEMLGVLQRGQGAVRRRQLVLLLRGAQDQRARRHPHAAQGQRSAHPRRHPRQRQVAQLYTGWIGVKVMEQVVANAVRGL